MRKEPTLLVRGCEATQIPSGQKVRLDQDECVIPTQVAEGNVTVMTGLGFLARIEARDAGALGPEYEELATKAAREAEARARRADGPFELAKVWEELRTVYDPEIPADIVELGLVYGVAAEPVEVGHKVLVTMTLTAPACGVGPMMVDEVKGKVSKLPGVSDVSVDLVFEPPWDPSRMSEAARLELGMF
jgi:probable FeS assembly SUF system protein SufT